MVPLMFFLGLGKSACHCFLFKVTIFPSLSSCILSCLTLSYKHKHSLSVATVMYQMVVIGKTSDVHLQLMAKVQAQVQDRVQLISCSRDFQVIIVFCPVGSRDGTDVDAAMTGVTGETLFSFIMLRGNLYSSVSAFFLNCNFLILGLQVCLFFPFQNNIINVSLYSLF